MTDPFLDWLINNGKAQTVSEADIAKAAWNAALATREEAPASDGEREPLCMAYKTGYAEGVEDSNGMFDRESCEEGWGQYAEKLSAQPAPEAEKLRMALEWYGEQARLARLIHSEGDKGRQALADDGGKRARQALAALQAEQKGKS